ncbi:ERV/ALR sulfhydryl oxidase domain-containing protein, partial [Pavlovales sp. CCMP2436]
TTQHKQATVEFLRALPVLYPCTECARDLEVAMGQMPPEVDSQEAFSLWVCELHNHVNEKMGKPRVHCNLQTLDEAWR